MKTLPRSLLRDTISVETYGGAGAYGPVYAAATTVLGRVSYVRQLVRNSEGVEVVSETTIYVQPDDLDSFPPQSRVTIDGRVSTVIGCGPQGRPGEAVLAKVTCS